MPWIKNRFWLVCNRLVTRKLIIGNGAVQILTRYQPRMGKRWATSTCAGCHHWVCGGSSREMSMMMLLVSVMVTHVIHSHCCRIRNHCFFDCLVTVWHFYWNFFNWIHQMLFNMTQYTKNWSHNLLYNIRKLCVCVCSLFFFINNRTQNV